MNNEYEIYLKELRQFLYDWNNHIKNLDFVPLLHYKFIKNMDSLVRKELKKCKEESEGAEIIKFRPKQ